MKMYVYSMREFDELPFFEKYCEQYGIEWEYTTKTPNKENLELAAGFDAVNIITTAIDKEMIDKWYDLGVRCISTRTIGYDHIDYEYAKSKGMGVIHITYSPGSVADYTVMLMLMGCRNIKYIMETANVQDYTLKGKIGKELSDCTVGVIGTGRIGKKVIENLSGFGCKILAYDICESDEVKQKAEYVELDKILTKCDIITMHAPATDNNYHIIDEKAIEKMKSGVILINCARGSLIDTDALIAGIESGKIGFAGLDVIEDEQGLYYFNRMGEPLNNPKLAILRSYANVIVTPHTAFYTNRAVSDMVENSIYCTKELLEGKDTPFRV